MGNLADARFRPEQFPVTFTARRVSDHEEVWTQTIENPGEGGLVGMHVPALAPEHGEVQMRVQMANGVDSGWCDP